jgi:hypothetical protein
MQEAGAQAWSASQLWLPDGDKKPMIVFPERDPRIGELWEALLELAAEHPDGWTLVGAQMVFLHALEHQANPPRYSADLDIVVDVRVLQRGVRIVAETLERLGYEFSGANIADIGHRFVRGSVSIDLLAPDGVGERADVRTFAGARTVCVPGGTQALQRSEAVEICVGERSGVVPRPNLLGAILLKARAVDVDDVPDSQRRELCFLLSLVDDPLALARELQGRQRTWLRRREELLDPAHPAWLGIQGAEDARITLKVLMGV